ncbi:MAG: winged helix-turn-helix domain-containing protein [Candidatus Eremiobacteraeota bacterium]|nr:winged helix-turn-helix domain-containing protein [Candidatus Eremiobacteraeota bacterium]
MLRDRQLRDPRLVVELIGARVTRDRQPLKLTDKELEFLTLLGSAHGSISRDRIGETLWGHLDPEEWPNNIKVTLSRLRTKLGVRDAVLSSNGGYRLGPKIEVDLRRAEALVRDTASALLDEAGRDALRRIVMAYRSGSAARYERFPWAQSFLVRIQDVVCTAGLMLAKDALRRSSIHEALTEARAVTDVDSLNESACELTIRAYLTLDDVDAARREFRRYAAVLESELATAPAPHLAALAQEPLRNPKLVGSYGPLGGTTPEPIGPARLPPLP